MKTAEKTSKRLHIWEIALLIGMAVFLISGAVSLQNRDQLADKVVRLHILANSDSEEDQALKLRVRDRVLERATELLEQTGDRREAADVLQSHLPELERIAAEEISDCGYEYDVTAEVANTMFPTKEYDGFTLPAGEYLALRIIIGEGNGHNWWCVVFPPLCTTEAADVPASALAAGFDEEEVALVTEENEGYVLKFKAMEWWEAIREKIE
ncbi:MAG: stage II sporulation protein R [Dysosmobacter sp.]|nr:stage II sporulation protein R [Dysosmobacter sp.]